MGRQIQRIQNGLMDRKEMNGGGWRRSGKRLVALMTLALLLLGPGMAWAVEGLKFKPAFNLFKMQQDVQLGKEHAEQLIRSFPS